MTIENIRAVLWLAERPFSAPFPPHDSGGGRERHPGWSSGVAHDEHRDVAPCRRGREPQPIAQRVKKLFAAFGLRADVEIVRAVEIRFVDDRTIERRFDHLA